MPAAKAFMNAWIHFEAQKVPVKLYAAARTEGSGFNQVHKHADGTVSKISQKNFCSGCNSDVPYANLSKGVPVGEDYIVVEQHELDALVPETNSNMVISKFVPFGQVDAVYFDKSYYVDLNPDKKLGDPRMNGVLFAWLYKIMQQAGYAAISKFCSRGKEHNIVIRIVGNKLMIHTLFTADEVRAVECFDPAKTSVSDAMVAKGLERIAELVGNFDPEELKDETGDKIAKLISQKTAAHSSPAGASTNAEPKPKTPASDDELLELLMASNAGAKAKSAGAKAN